MAPAGHFIGQLLASLVASIRGLAASPRADREFQRHRSGAVADAEQTERKQPSDEL